MTTDRLPSPVRWLATGLWLLAGGCLPYTVATTAQPVPEGESRVTAMVFPAGQTFRDLGGVAVLATDVEARTGLGGGADLGIRVPASAGVIASYKRRIAGDEAPDPALAVMGGAGLMNVGQHAYFETAILASGRQRRLTPYGGARVIQLASLSDASSGSPTLGAFLGARVGSDELGIGVEVGVYRDRSTPFERTRDVVVVPALVLHGRELLELLRFIRFVR